MSNKREGIPFNGFQSVIEMFRYADAGFRNKLLQNIRNRDPALARKIEVELREIFSQDDGRSALTRSQRNFQARNYGN